MIYIDRVVTISKGVARINEPIVLYRGDRDVTIRFNIDIKNISFSSGYSTMEYERPSSGQIAILKPNNDMVFSEITRFNNEAMEFILREDLLNELKEVGDYSFHIRLFDTTQQSRITLPEIKNGITVREPVVTEDHNGMVDEAIVDFAILRESMITTIPTTNEDGSYNATNWSIGDQITIEKLNKIESALSELYAMFINQHNENIAMNDALNKQQVNNFEVLSNQIEVLTSEIDNLKK